jgi:hypothetical protein
VNVLFEPARNSEVRVNEIDKIYIEIVIDGARMWITRDQGYDLINKLEPHCVDVDDQYETLQARIYKLEMA